MSNLNFPDENEISPAMMAVLNDRQLKLKMINTSQYSGNNTGRNLLSESSILIPSASITSRRKILPESVVYADTDSMFVNIDTLNKGPNTDRICGVCGNTSSFICGRCKRSKYCSRKCQLEDWSNHKNMCNILANISK